MSRKVSTDTDNYHSLKGHCAPLIAAVKTPVGNHRFITQLFSAPYSSRHGLALSTDFQLRIKPHGNSGRLQDAVITPEALGRTFTSKKILISP